MSQDQRAAERLYAATGITLEEIQVVGVEGDPDVEAMARQRIEAVKEQASTWMKLRANLPVRGVSARPLPVPVWMACDFCGAGSSQLELRWKMIRFVGVPLGGRACRDCWPLDRKAIEKVYAARMKARAA